MGGSSVSAARAGLGRAQEIEERASLAELYRRFEPRVRARCRRLLCGKHTAEDATQEIFLKLLLRASALTPGEATWTFLRRVTTNHCLNQLRNESRRREARFPIDTCVPAPTDRIVDGELVAKLLAGVPVELTVVGWLNHVDELDQRDIAERLSISRRTVVSRLSSFNARAKRRLRSLSTPQGSCGECPLPVAPAQREGSARGLAAHEDG
jgi:RNA polymerase sigma factor (sigma-70 family)